MIQLIKGDCLVEMKNIPDKSIDLILTDPPYGTTACKWDSVIPFELMWDELKRIRKDNGAIVLFGAEPFSSYLRMSNITEFRYDWVWVKSKPSGAMTAKKQPMKANEMVSVFYKTSPRYNPIMTERTEAELKRLSKKSVLTVGSDASGAAYGYSGNREDNKLKYPNNILNFKSVFNRSKEKTPHPTQKPVDLLEYLIKTYTNEGETVLDFTMGSGSTGVACVNTNRNFIGIEMDDKYFDIAVKRINEAQPKNELF